ncbi:hypothetical protein D3C85_1877450 [compost metagenome]
MVAAQGLEMVQNAPAGKHAGAGNDYLRIWICTERLRILPGTDIGHAFAHGMALGVA